jgi:hypothetical protein
MPYNERQHFPAWAERQRMGDMAWIGENLYVLWPAAQQGFEQFGRGALVVDTTQRPTGEGHPFAYFPQETVTRAGKADTIRMVEEYNPPTEMVTVLLKAEDRISSYRIAVVVKP